MRNIIYGIICVNIFFYVPISSTVVWKRKTGGGFLFLIYHEHFLQAADCTDHKQGLKKVLELLNFGKGYSGIAAVGHRVVHGGETLTEPTIITHSVKRAIEKAIPLAPLHNPPNLQV
jgi:acetate kinase